MNPEIITYSWGGYRFEKIAQDQMAYGVNDDIVAVISKLDLSGKNIIDGGANIGIYSVYLSSLGGG